MKKIKLYCKIVTSCIFCPNLIVLEHDKTSPLVEKNTVESMQCSIVHKVIPEESRGLIGETPEWCPLPNLDDLDKSFKEKFVLKT